MLVCQHAALFGNCKKFCCLRVQILDEEDLGRQSDASRIGLAIRFGLKSDPTHYKIGVVVNSAVPDLKKVFHK